MAAALAVGIFSATFRRPLAASACGPVRSPPARLCVRARGNGNRQSLNYFLFQRVDIAFLNLPLRCAASLYQTKCVLRVTSAVCLSLGFSVRSAIALVLLTVLLPPLRAQIVASPGYPDSTDGFRQQLEDLVATKKSGDETAFRSKLNALAIPNASDWISGHFSPADVARLQRDYPVSLAGFQRHLTWVIGDASHLPGWDMAVKPSELPRPPAVIGKESAVPAPTEPVSVENFRYGPAHPEDHPEGSWVNSFVYIDGRFRYVGGTYPFWAEELQGIRGYQASPPTGPVMNHVSAARILRKVAPDYPKKARKAHVEGVVRLHAIIGKDGAIQDLSVISGDPLLTEAAMKAVRQWRYEPTLLNGDPVEVDTTIDVIFALNH